MFIDLIIADLGGDGKFVSVRDTSRVFASSIEYVEGLESDKVQLLARVAEQAHRLEVSGRLVDQWTDAALASSDEVDTLKARVAELDESMGAKGGRIIGLSKERNRAWIEVESLKAKVAELEEAEEELRQLSESNKLDNF